ncbi:hypothetical protein DFH28DRAFT_878832, partial [Melampsora americana]
NIQKSWQKEGKEELSGLDVKAKEKYLLDQDVFIGLMDIEKPYIGGLENHLNSEVEMDGKPFDCFLNPTQNDL